MVSGHCSHVGYYRGLHPLSGGGDTADVIQTRPYDPFKAVPRRPGLLLGNMKSATVAFGAEASENWAAFLGNPRSLHQSDHSLP
jgi:hypothetical protein